LSEVRIEAEGPLEEAALVAGKYLSPRLYVSYGVGLFEPINTFRLRYMLSSRWTLQAETGKAAGADALYRIERGR
jgi:translocation and assembly module TamB